MFVASRALGLLEEYRIPTVLGGRRHLSGFHELRGEAVGRRLLWPADDDTDLGPTVVEVQLGQIPLFARVVPDSAAERRLGDGWVAAEPLVARDGTRAGCVYRSSEGDVFLPFDPDEADLVYRSERYEQAQTTSASRGGKQIALRFYYAVRPLLPRPLQIRLRRVFSRVQARRRFPRWPAEPALHELHSRLLQEVRALVDEPVPFIGAWPDGKEWAFVLTHDVETEVGYDHIHLMRDLEIAHGFRSSWNFVPYRYEVQDELVARLWEGGFEVGVHGLYHDGRDLASHELLSQRLPAIRGYAERWSAVGFRSPATHRDWELMRLLGFDYDSSSPETDPFEPQAGGCCTWLPFFNGDLVELPITLPQDHALFVILARTHDLWLEKTRYLRERGGMALLITHPDYMLDTARLRDYEGLLESVEDDETMWRPLPWEVSAWWRRRAASQIVRGGSGWAIAGPVAGEGRIQLLEPLGGVPIERLADSPSDPDR